MTQQKTLFSSINKQLSPVKKSLACGALGLSLATFSTAGISSEVNPRIVGGSAAAEGQFPWQVALINDIGKAYETQFCGGTIIHESWILTAAHCFSENSSNIYVVGGILDLTAASSGVSAQSLRWIVHEDFNQDTLNNDIALIELKTPLDLSSCGTQCEAIGLVTPKNEANVAFNASFATVSGWGNTVGGVEPTTSSYPTSLRFATLNILSCTTSPANYSTSEITSNMFCAGVASFDKDSCQGDSGGPLVVANNEGTGSLLAGIVSWGNECAVQGYPGVYTRVSQYNDWINTNTKGACCESVTGEIDEPTEPTEPTEPEDTGDTGGDTTIVASSSSSSSGSMNSIALLALAGFALLRRKAKHKSTKTQASAE